jgi:hypothetical protein
MFKGWDKVEIPIEVQAARDEEKLRAREAQKRAEEEQQVREQQEATRAVEKEKDEICLVLADAVVAQEENLSIVPEAVNAPELKTLDLKVSAPNPLRMESTAAVASEVLIPEIEVPVLKTADVAATEERVTEIKTLAAKAPELKAPETKIPDVRSPRVGRFSGWDKVDPVANGATTAARQEPSTPPLEQLLEELGLSASALEADQGLRAGNSLDKAIATISLSAEGVDLQTRIHVAEALVLWQVLS